MGTLSEMSINILDLSYFDRNHFIIFPKPPLRPSSSQDVKNGIIISGVETSLWQDFIQRLEGEFDGDYDPVEEKLCVYFHQGPRYLSFIIVFDQNRSRDLGSCMGINR